MEKIDLDLDNISSKNTFTVRYRGTLICFEMPFIGNVSFAKDEVSTSSLSNGSIISPTASFNPQVDLTLSISCVNYTVNAANRVSNNPNIEESDINGYFK